MSEFVSKFRQASNNEGCLQLTDDSTIIINNFTDEIIEKTKSVPAFVLSFRAPQQFQRLPPSEVINTQDIAFDGRNVTNRHKIAALKASEVGLMEGESKAPSSATIPTVLLFEIAVNINCLLWTSALSK
ncbi:hypothetical protein EDC96DRAFT_549242 [Choanephora cucurbitarum]|nr:hypothetical protein EDC96DRAFT_549242 [Choanephora cucurbitarum]